MNKNMKHSIFSASLIFLFANLCFAQQISTETKISPEKQVLIKEYFEVTGGRDAVDKNFEAIFANINNTLPMLLSTQIEQDSRLTLAQKADFQKSMPAMAARMGKRFQEELKREIDFAKLVEEVNYPLLDKFFTVADLKDLIAFYKSPTGQKAITLQPQIYTEATTRLNAVLLPAVQKVMKKITDEETAEMIKNTKQDK